MISLIFLDKWHKFEDKLLEMNVSILKCIFCVCEGLLFLLVCKHSLEEEMKESVPVTDNRDETLI